MSEWMDGDYPTEAAIGRLKAWDVKSQSDIDELWAFARGLWIYPDRFVPIPEMGYSADLREWLGDVDWYVSTGGWSGHEDAIYALRSHFIFWSLCWRVHRAGGHFWFRIGGALKP